MARESHVLDGLNLADGVVFDIADTPTFTPAPLRLDWIGGADSDGSVPLNPSHSDNCTLVLPLRITQQTTADLAWDKVGQLVTKLEATRASSDGLTHLWTPKDASDTWVLTVLSAEITGVPMDSRGDTIGYLLRELRFTITLTCKPYLYRNGELVTYTTVQSYTNLITNPNFETNTTSWGTSNSFRNATGATLSRQTTQFHSGVASMRIVSTAVVTQGADYTTLPVVIARPVTVAMWLRGNAGGEVVHMILGDGTVGAVASTPITLTTSWQRTSATLTPIATGTTGVSIVQDVASVKTWFVDDVIVVYATTAPTYFDGGTDVTRNAWTGTANASTSTQDGPVLSMTLADIPGDVDAEASITITDTALQSRRHVEWGLGEDSAAAILIDSSQLVTSGFAGAATTATGAYASLGTVRCSLAAQTQAVCGTGNLTHIGTFRAKARVKASSANVRLRFAYRTGNGPYTYTPWLTPIAPGAVDFFEEAAFGVITIGTVTLGTQQWDGRFEAYSTTIDDTIEVDYLEMLPAERWGKARGQYSYQPGLLVARDEFTTITATTVLNGRTAPLPAVTWASTGSATDFAAADAPGTLETMMRATTSDASSRIALLGSAAYATIEVGVDFYVTNATTSIKGVLARYVDSANNLTVWHVGSSLQPLVMFATVASSVVAVVSAPAPITTNAWYTIRVVVFASGVAIASVVDASGATVGDCSLQHSSLATSGTIDDGKIGFVDNNSSVTAITRYYDNFYGATPATEPLALNSGRSLVVRHDSCEVASSDGLTYGPPKSYTGGRALIPCAGDSDRVTRVWTKARRNDIDVTNDTNVTDALSLGVSLRPRYRLPT